MSEKQSINRIDGEPSSLPQSPRRWTRWLGVFLILFAVLAAWLLGVAYFGTQSGQKERVEMQQMEMEGQIARQVELAQEDVDNGRSQLAARRLKWVLEQSPHHSLAVVLMEEITAVNPVPPTPLPVATPSVVQATATPSMVTDVDAELNRIEALIAEQKWEQAISALSTFQRQFPSIERPRTDLMQYESLIAYGLDLLNGDQIERGLYYLEQAELLGDLPQEALDYQLWGETYLQGIAFYDVKWDVAAYHFRNLCLAAPFYQSACSLLHESLIGYGDTYAYNQDWCPAKPLYQEALTYDSTPELVEKLTKAREGCLQATPVPEGVITDTVDSE